MVNVLHNVLVPPELHEPKLHASKHESGGSDAINLTAAKVLIGDASLSGFTNGILTSSLVFENQVANGNYELWSNGSAAAPDGWTLSGTVLREPVIKVIGNYSAKLTGDTVVDTYLSQSIHTFRGMSYWRGRTVSVSMLVRADTAGVVRARLYDGLTFIGSSAYHVGGSTWQQLTCTGTVDIAATQVTVFLYVEPNSPAATAYFDGVMTVEGAAPFGYTPKPSESLASGLTPVIISSIGVGIGVLPEEDLDVLGNIQVTGYLTDGTANQITVQQLIDLQTGGIDLTQNTLTMGDGAALIDKDYRVDIGGANYPTLRYDVGTSKWQFSNDGVYFADMGTGGGGGGTGVATVIEVTQALHGFLIGDVLYFNGASYAKSQANAVATSEVSGMVSGVTDINTFDLTTAGYVAGLSGLTPGTVYFLSDSVAGGLQSAEPAVEGYVSKPVFTALSATSGLFANYRGMELLGVATTPQTYIQDADGDTWVKTELNPDEDKVRIATFGVIRMIASSAGIQIGANPAIGDGYILPLTPGANGQILKTDGLGNVTWQTPSETDTLAAVTARGAITTVAIQVGGLSIKGLYSFPIVDGLSGQVMITNGSGTLSWYTLAGETDTLHMVTGRGAATTNAIQVGGLSIKGLYSLPIVDGTSGQVMKTNGAGVVTWQANNSIDTLNDVCLRGATTAAIVQVGTLKIGTAMTFPTTDGTSGQVLRTNGAGAVTWATQTLATVTAGGSTTTANLTIGNLVIGSGAAGIDYTLRFDGETNDGTITWMEDENYFLFNKAVRLGAFTFPIVDGTIGQVLKTDGSGIVTWQNESGGGSGGRSPSALTYDMSGDLLGILSDTRLITAWEVAPPGTPTDLSGKSHVCAYNGGMLAGARVTQGYVYAINLDGVNDYIGVTDAGDLTFGDGSNDSPFSVGCWTSVTATASIRTLLAKYNTATGSENREWNVNLTATGLLRLTIADESVNVEAYRQSNAAISAGWHFIVVSYSGLGGSNAANAITLYVDGVAVASTATNNPSYVAMEDTVSQVTIGGRVGNTPIEFNDGAFGVSFITKEELSSSDIWLLYLKTRGYYNL